RHTRFSRDWSSDVCSSDLCRWRRFPHELGPGRVGHVEGIERPPAPAHAGVQVDLLRGTICGKLLVETKLAIEKIIPRLGLGPRRSEERRVGKECRSRRLPE